MQFNQCPKCWREPELVGSFKFDKINNRMRFYGWLYKCPKHNVHTYICKTPEKAAEQWNELTKGVNK